MHHPVPSSRRLLAVLIGTLAVVALMLSGPVAHTIAQDASDPGLDTDTDAQVLLRQPCFGAAAVDPQHPCSNPNLAMTVYPPPAQARALQQNMGCDHRESAGNGLLDICFFGASPRNATRTVALLGDSHAAHWRNALDVVLAAHRWRAISVQRAGCPLTLGHPDLPSADRVSGCMDFNKAVQQWMAAHPEIDVVFTSQHRGSVVPPKGQLPGAARRAGYIKAWEKLLTHNVRQIVVIRDTPRIATTTIPCVEQAIADHQLAGSVCALKSSFALRSDPAVDAARQLGSPQVQVADLATFFCRRKLCPPVAGGALVLRDVTHMTTTYSTTLGPYLLQRVNQLMKSWAPQAAPVLPVLPSPAPARAG
jgi:hypothetical protein